ncbi:MAG: hypothetical protein K0U47_09880 [Epsilonproteobacteria bacterium]|nr:hypothetical protein [Campylobacterota bacterium]
MLLSFFILYDRYDMRQPVVFEALQQIDPLPHTKTLIAEERWQEAEAYLSFFNQHDYIKNNLKAQTLLAEIQSKRAETGYKTLKVVNGVIYGKSDEFEGQIAAGVSDLFLFGDIRDLMIEGYHHVNDQEVDKVLVALSTIGVVATGVTWISAGTTAPVKGSLSFLKFAKKSGKMPSWLGKYLIKSSKEVQKTKDLQPLTGFMQETYTMVQKSGVNGSLTLLSHTTDLKSFQKAVDFSKRYEKKSAVFLQVGGKEVLKATPQNIDKEILLYAASYGKQGVNRLMKLGEKGFLKSLIKPVKVSRMVKVFDKNIVTFLKQIPDTFFWLLGLVALVFLL